MSSELTITYCHFNSYVKTKKRQPLYLKPDRQHTIFTTMLCQNPNRPQQQMQYFTSATATDGNNIDNDSSRFVLGKAAYTSYLAEKAKSLPNSTSSTNLLDRQTTQNQPNPEPADNDATTIPEPKRIDSAHNSNHSPNSNHCHSHTQSRRASSSNPNSNSNPSKIKSQNKTVDQTATHSNNPTENHPQETRAEIITRHLNAFDDDELSGSESESESDATSSFYSSDADSYRDPKTQIYSTRHKPRRPLKHREVVDLEFVNRKLGRFCMEREDGDASCEDDSEDEDEGEGETFSRPWRGKGGKFVRNLRKEVWVEQGERRGREMGRGRGMGS